MDKESIRGLSDQDIDIEQAKAGEQLFRLRFRKGLGNQEGTKGMRLLKLDIARLQTIARERALAAERELHPVHIPAAPAASQRTARKRAMRS